MRQKGFTPILIVIIIALVGIAGAYYFGTKKENIISTPAETPSFVATNSPTQTIKPTADPTANWKTYTETQYGFSFKYQLSEVVNRNEYNSTYGGKEVVLATKYNGNSFDWFIEENSKGVSFDTFVKDFSDQSGTVTSAAKTIGEISGILAEVAGSGSQLEVDYAHLEFYMVGENNSLFRLRLYTSGMTVTDSDRQLFNTILESIEIK